jgi:autotransporter passenger strand-loop-strand repeat protein
LSGGSEIVSGGGADIGALISGGALLDYGTASGVKLFTGSEMVESGGTASGSVLSGGTETVSAGGSDIGAAISGGKQLDYGFAGVATIFKGSQTVAGGGTASGTTVRSGGALLVSAGGLAEAITISSGGAETVSAHGSDLGASILGGKQLDFGFAGGATVFTGSGVVEFGGTASGTTVRSSAALLVSSGGLAEATTISNGGSQTISAHGSDLGAIISGGKQLDFGVARGAIVFAGSQVVQSSGVASATTMLSGGTETVSAHGSDFGAQISGGIELDYGLATGATIFAGSQVVESAGTAINTIVSSGGTLDLLKGGVAIGTVVASGGTFEVGSSAVVSGVTVGNLVGATQSDTTLAAGATLEIGAGEKLSGFTAGSGVTLEVLSGGTVANTTVASGGTFVASGLVTVSGSLSLNGTTSIGAGAIVKTVSSGTVTLAGAVGNSGTLFASGAHSVIDIAAGALVTGGGVPEVGNGIVDIQATGDKQNVVFLSGGTGGLEVNDTTSNPTASGGTILGFGQNTKQFIDLAAVASGTGVNLSYTSNGASSGVLTVSSGGTVGAAINFAGSYTTSSFHITSGTSGTVEIFDPPLVSTVSLVSAAHRDGDDGVDHGGGDSGPITWGGHHIGGIGSSSVANDSALLTYVPLKQAVSMLNSSGSTLTNSNEQTSLLWGNNAKLHAEMIASLHDALISTSNDTPLLYDSKSALFGQAMASFGTNDLSTAHDSWLPTQYHGGFHELPASDTHTLALTRAASSADTILAVPHHG